MILIIFIFSIKIKLNLCIRCKYFRTINFISELKTNYVLNSYIDHLLNVLMFEKFCFDRHNIFCIFIKNIFQNLSSISIT